MKIQECTNFVFPAITCHRCEPNKKVPRPPCMQNKAFFSFQLCPADSSACYNINTGKTYIIIDLTKNLKLSDFLKKLSLPT